MQIDTHEELILRLEALLYHMSFCDHVESSVIDTAIWEMRRIHDATPTGEGRKGLYWRLQIDWDGYSYLFED